MNVPDHLRDWHDKNLELMAELYRTWRRLSVSDATVRRALREIGESQAQHMNYHDAGLFFDLIDQAIEKAADQA